MPVTAFYASLLASLFIFLALNIIRQRKASRIALGHAGDLVLQRYVRAHANFSEYVPLGLILLGAAETLGAYVWLLHLAGAAFVGARALHAYGISQIEEDLRFRLLSMSTTFAVLAVLSLTCLILSLKAHLGF